MKMPNNDRLFITAYPPFKQILIKKFQWDEGITLVPMRGRASNIPFAANILTASLIAVRLAWNLSDNSISLGRIELGK